MIAGVGGRGEVRGSNGKSQVWKKIVQSKIFYTKIVRFTPTCKGVTALDNWLSGYLQRLIYGSLGYFVADCIKRACL